MRVCVAKSVYENDYETPALALEICSNCLHSGNLCVVNQSARMTKNTMHWKYAETVCAMKACVAKSVCKNNYEIPVPEICWNCLRNGNLCGAKSICENNDGTPALEMCWNCVHAWILSCETACKNDAMGNSGLRNQSATTIMNTLPGKYAETVCPIPNGNSCIAKSVCENDYEITALEICGNCLRNGNLCVAKSVCENADETTALKICCKSLRNGNICVAKLVCEIDCETPALNICWNCLRDGEISLRERRWITRTAHVLKLSTPGKLMCCKITCENE